MDRSESNERSRRHRVGNCRIESDMSDKKTQRGRLVRIDFQRRGLSGATRYRQRRSEWRNERGEATDSGNTRQREGREGLIEKKGEKKKWPIFSSGRVGKRTAVVVQTTDNTPIER